MASRITEQTTKWLVEALFDLMKTKDYSQISVTEICKKAQLSRKTFYRKFKSKREIIDYYFDQEISKYLSYIKEQMPQNFHDFVTIFFTFWEKEQAKLKILQKNNLLISMLYKFNTQGFEMYNSTNLPLHIPNKPTTNNQIKLLLDFSIGGFWNIISNQLKKNGTLSTKELATDINNALLQLFK